MINGQQSLPPEITLREVVGDTPTGVFIGGLNVIGNVREIEVCNMRGDVLRRLSLDDAHDWVTRHNYRYVPRTQGHYHRQPRTADAEPSRESLREPRPEARV